MIQVLIQVAAGSHDKAFYDERTLEYRETRRIAQAYPYPYGFIIGTSAADGDCVDCYVVTAAPLQPGAIVECEPAGLLVQDENGESDHKILTSLPGQEVDLGHGLLQELQVFIYAIFAKYPEARIRVGPILPREAALQYIQEAQAQEQHSMPAHQAFADLFKQTPAQWNLRGDPYLWEEMKTTLEQYAYPSAEAQLRALIEQIFQQLTGASLASAEPIFVERYSHGGMSSGYVSPKFWSEKVIPMLLARFQLKQ